MKLPIYELGIDGQSNLNTEGPELRPITSNVEMSPDDILSPNKRFKVTGNVAYVLEDSFTDDWTLEVLPHGPISSGILISSSGYGDREGYGMGIMWLGQHFKIYRSTPKDTFLWHDLITPEKKFKRYPTIQIVKTGNIINIYTDGELIHRRSVSTLYTAGTVNLLGVALRGSANSSPRGNYESIRFNPRHALEPSMFYMTRMSDRRDLELSTFVTEGIGINNLGTKMIEDVSTYLNNVIIKYNNGEFDSYYRPLGTDHANWFTQITQSSGELTARDNLGKVFRTDISAEPKYPIVGTAVNEVGYKVSDEFKGLSASGTYLDTVDGKLTRKNLINQSIDHATRVKAVCTLFAQQYKAFFERTGRFEYPVIWKQSEVKVGHTDLLGNFIFSPGVYYYEGYIAKSPGNYGQGGIIDTEGNVLSRFPTFGGGKEPSDKEIVMTHESGFMTIKEPCTINIYTVLTNKRIYSYTTSEILDLNFYKVR